MKHIKTINNPNIKNSLCKPGCKECANSCQSACRIVTALLYSAL
ncbi:MAG: six-cysteine ranthipeptide SCIFF [Clostridium sp.]|nr:six-cysteine ranthipeptide SCIFF [Clostridium sp.]MDU3038113.1 six-cysteine ranthipeptide SCIFF [Clostridium sp.]